MSSLPDENHEVARLKWRCRRGMLELDLMLRGFLEQEYSQLGSRERECFHRLLGLPDQRLLEYLLYGPPDKEKEFKDVIKRIRATAAN